MLAEYRLRARELDLDRQKLKRIRTTRAATIDGAARHGRPVSVCGGLASDVAAAPILIGLGVRGLSAAAAQIPALKARIHNVTLDQCRQIAGKALAASSAAEVRALALSMGDT